MSKFLGAWDLPTGSDLYVQCKEAVWARPKPPSTESEGVNFKGALVRNGAGADVASGDLYMKWPGNEDNLTNPFRISCNEKGFWKAYPLDEQPPLPVGAAPPPKEANAWTGVKGGGGGFGGSGKTMTREQLGSAIEYAVGKTESVGTELGIGTDARAVGEVFSKVLGCAMFVDWGEPAATGGQADAPAGQDAPPAPSDDDIPF
jgi:hypothetical protein